MWMIEENQSNQSNSKALFKNNLQHYGKEFFYRTSIRNNRTSQYT